MTLQPINWIIWPKFHSLQAWPLINLNSYGEFRKWKIRGKKKPNLNESMSSSIWEVWMSEKHNRKSFYQRRMRSKWIYLVKWFFFQIQLTFSTVISIYNFNIWNSSLPIWMLSLSWECVSRRFFNTYESIKCHSSVGGFTENLPKDKLL